MCEHINSVLVKRKKKEKKKKEIKVKEIKIPIWNNDISIKIIYKIMISQKILWKIFNVNDL